jgi:hypothetical protein
MQARTWRIINCDELAGPKHFALLLPTRAVSAVVMMNDQIRDERNVDDGSYCT